MEAIGGYRLVRRLGAGGMGTVSEAVDADGRRVAIKVLHPAISADPAARDRLRREVALLHRVRGPRVARVLDAEVDDVEAFVVTELIDGPTLDERVRTGGPLDPDELSELAHGLADGLAAIHRAGVTHRDLKPGNVMLSAEGPVIIDFGIAQVADDARLTQTGLVTGTPGYLAPEIVAGADPGPGGDWWSWAAVLTYAATGRPPFGRGPFQAVLARVGNGEVDTDGLDDVVAAALRAALRPRPRVRLWPDGLLEVLDGRWGHRELAAALATLQPPDDADRQVTRAVPAVPPDAGAHTSALLGAPATRALPAYRAGGWPADGSNPVGGWPADGSNPVPLPAPAQPGWGEWGGGREPWAPPGGPLPAGPWPTGAEPAPQWLLPPRRRAGIVTLAGLSLASLAAIVPGVFAVATLALLVVLGALGLGARARRSWRLRRGLRPGDTTGAVLAGPWFLVRAAVAALPGALAGAVVGAGVWLLAGALLLPGDPTGTALLWAGGFVVAALAWTMPSSGAAREGARIVLGGIGRPGRTTVVVLSLLGVAIAGAAVLTGAPEPAWAPLPVPPDVL